MLIVFVSIIGLGLSFIFGWRFHKSKFWEWTDAIYYPLAIVGVVLLFLEGENTRRVAGLEDDRRSLAIELEAIERSRPDDQAQLVDPEFVRNNAEFLRMIARLNRNCESNPSALPVCSVVGSIAPIVAPGELALARYQGPEDLGEICRVANEIFSNLDKSDYLSSFLMDSVADHYFSGLKIDFAPFDFEATRGYIDELRPRLEREASSMLEALELSPDDQSLIFDHYDAQIQWGGSILQAFEPCLRAPESIRSGEYERWASEQLQTRTAAEEVEEEIRQLRLHSPDLNEAAIFRVSYWPFLIILALLMKFSKGIATLRKPKESK